MGMGLALGRARSLDAQSSRDGNSSGGEEEGYEEDPWSTRDVEVLDSLFRTYGMIRTPLGAVLGLGSWSGILFGFLFSFFFFFFRSAVRMFCVCLPAVTATRFAFVPRSTAKPAGTQVGEKCLKKCGVPTRCDICLDAKSLPFSSPLIEMAGLIDASKPPPSTKVIHSIMLYRPTGRTRVVLPAAPGTPPTPPSPRPLLWRGGRRRDYDCSLCSLLVLDKSLNRSQRVWTWALEA